MRLEVDPLTGLLAHLSEHEHPSPVAIGAKKISAIIPCIHISKLRRNGDKTPIYF